MILQLKFRNYLKLIILFGFVYQLFDSINDYLKFNELIELSFGNDHRLLPSITVCLDQKYKIENEQFELKCHFENNDDERKDCFELDDSKYIRNYLNNTCLTILNVISDSMFDSLRMKFWGYKRAKIIYHPKKNPSHFERRNIIKFKNLGKYYIYMNKFESTLLPAPYKTDCQDYSIENYNGFKSQSDCKLEYMRRKELKICGKNYYWIQYYIQNIDDMERVQNISQTIKNCSVRAIEKLLNKVCKPDCQSISLSSEMLDVSRYNSKISIKFYKMQNIFIKLDHSPKMDLIIFISNIGGLISMYFGLGVYDMTSSIFNNFTSKCRNIIFLIRKNDPRNRFKSTLKIIKMIFLLIMFYQLFEITKDFIVNNEMIEIVFKTDIILPKIKVHFEILMDNEIIKNEYQSFWNTIKNEDDEDKKWENRMKLQEILSNNISLVKHITGFDNLSIECQIYSTKTSFDCSNVTEYFEINHAQQTYLGYQFFDTTTDVSKYYSKFNTHIEQISIKFLGKFATYSAFLFFFSNTNSKSIQEYTYSSQSLFSNHLHNIAIESSSVRHQKSSGCVDDNYGLFTDTLNDQIVADCSIQEYNDTFGCIPVFQGFDSIVIRLERDLIYFNYKICPNNITTDNISQDDLISRLMDCYNKFPNICESQIFNVINNHQLSVENIPYQFNIFPKYNLITQLKYKNRMDFNDWVYNCGGIVGMWFGWSALSITSVLLIIKYYFKKLMFSLKPYWIQHKMINESRKFSFSTIDNKQVIVFH